MVKQDYLVRMIQEIISAIARAILNKKKIRQQDRDEYDLLTQQMLGFPVKELATMDVRELIDRYANEEDRIGKIELASVYLLRFSEEVEIHNVEFVSFLLLFIFVLSFNHDLFYTINPNDKL